MDTFLQAVDEPFFEALKEEYIGYGGRMPFDMIKHLQTKITKVTNEENTDQKGSGHQVGTTPSPLCILHAN